MSIWMDWLTWMIVALGALGTPQTCDSTNEDGTLTRCGLQQVIEVTWPEHLHDDAHELVGCESNANPMAYNRNDPHGGSRGLFQVNGIHAWRYRGQDIYDPLVNSMIAYDIYQQQGRRAWFRCTRRLGLFR